MSFSLLLWSPAGSLAAGSVAGVAVRDLTFTLGIDLFAGTRLDSSVAYLVRTVSLAFVNPSINLIQSTCAQRTLLRH